MAAVMLFACAACGTNNEPEETVTLTWFIPGDEQPDSALVVDEINKIIEPEIGVKLDLKFISQAGYAEKMRMLMASGGKDFDICFTSNWLNPYDTAARDGGLYDITDLIDDELKATMNDTIWEASKVDGKLYAVPNNQMMFQQLAVAFRKDIVEKYDFDLSTIKNINDIEPFLEVIKKNEPKLYPFNNRWMTSPWTYDSIPQIKNTSGIGFRVDTNEIVSYYEQPEVIAALEKINDWYEKGYIRKDFASSGADTNASEINAGKYAVKVETWKPGIEKLSASTVDYVYQPITGISFGSPTAAMTGVSAACEYPEKAVELIKVVNTNKEVYNLLCYGIEGKHYTLNEEGKLEFPETTGYKAAGDWKYGNQFNAYITAGMDDDVWEVTERMNNEAVVTPYSDFVFDTDPVRTQVAQVASADSEYSGGGMTTTKDLTKFLADRMKLARDSGFDDVLAEVKKQMAEHIASKK